jgi:DNA topoisomerase IA
MEVLQCQPVRVEDKRQGPPKLHDLPSLHKLCGSRFGWSASKTLDVAQELYDGQGKQSGRSPKQPRGCTRAENPSRRFL